MNWWDEVKVDGLTITSTPGRHFTGRVPWKNNKTLWSGYVFKNNKYTTYFTGIPVMEIISRKFMKSLVTLIY